MQREHAAIPPIIRAKSWLDALMREEEITAVWLADQLGVADTTVSRWRNGLVPRREQQERIAAALAERLGRPVPIRELWP